MGFFSNMKSEAGNVLTFLLGGVAIVGIVSFGGYQLLSGPLSSASEISQSSMAQNQMLTILQIATMDAVNQTGGGDCDGDSFVEPRAWRDAGGGDAPTNGGLLPLGMGAPTIDPWGQEYGYCVWDVGPIYAAGGCNSGTGYLDGADNPLKGESQTLTVLATISAGPDKSFQTTCSDYVDDTTDLITNTGDDIIHRYSYAQAAKATSSLWYLKAGESSMAETGYNLEVGNNIAFDTGLGSIQASSLSATGKMIANGGLLLGTQVDVGSCSAGDAGTLRYNTSSNELQICTTGGWEGAGGAASGVSFPLEAPDGSAAEPSYGFNSYSTSGLYLGANGPELIAPSGKNMILAGGNSDIVISDSGIVIDSNGSLDIDALGGSGNTTFETTAGTDFRVISEGGVQIGTTSETCTLTAQGTIRYAAGTKNFEYCDGSDWQDLTEPEENPYTIAGGWGHICGIDIDARLWCAGPSSRGRLGIGDVADSTQPTPVEVAGGGSWRAVNVGSTSCGIKSDDTLWCWGMNDNGEIGDGTTGVDRTSPTQVIEPGPWSVVSNSLYHTCAIKKDDQSLWCWGTGGSGEDGSGDTTSSATPREVSFGGAWKDVSAGFYHTCGIQTDGTAWCWGNNPVGAAGNGSSGTNLYTKTAVSGGGTWKKIYANNYFSCGIKSDDSGWCWGMNQDGELGIGNTTNTNVPTEISGGSSWKALGQTTGQMDHMCGLKTDGTAWCWGEGSYYRLGTGNITDRTTPYAVTGGHIYSAIGLEKYGGCGTRKDGSQMCWGRNELGQNGTGTTSQNTAPTLVLATQSSITAECTSPWATQVGNGSSITAYKEADASVDGYCLVETRTCSAGTLSGTYTNQSCTPPSNPYCPHNSGDCTKRSGGNNYASGTWLTDYAYDNTGCNGGHYRPVCDTSTASSFSCAATNGASGPSRCASGTATCTKIGSNSCIGGYGTCLCD